MPSYQCMLVALGSIFPDLEHCTERIWDQLNKTDSLLQSFDVNCLSQIQQQRVREPAKDIYEIIKHNVDSSSAFKPCVNSRICSLSDSPPFRLLAWERSNYQPLIADQKWVQSQTVWFAAVFYPLPLNSTNYVSRGWRLVLTGQTE